MSRTTSARVGDGNTATGRASAGTRPSRTHAAGQAAAEFRPQLAEHAKHEGRMIHQRDVPALLRTGGRKHAGQHQSRGRAMGEDVGAQALLPVATAVAVAQRDLVGDIEVGRRRLGGNAQGLCHRIGHQLQRHGLEVQQQGVRRHVVWPRRLGIEAPRVVAVGGKGRAIEHQVAANFADATRANHAQQAAELVIGQLGIAAAPEMQIALQHPVCQTAADKGLGLPGVGRAEQVECRKGGDQLHGRGRVQRGTRIHRQARRHGIDFAYPGRRGRGRNARRLQRGRDGRRQFIGARTGEEQGSENYERKPHFGDLIESIANGGEKKEWKCPPGGRRRKRCARRI
jgi:hypothetical protein